MSGDVAGSLPLTLDAEHRRFTSRVIPYSVERIWPHLAKSYLEIQSFLHAAQETASPVRLVPGSPDGVGAVIELDWNGSPVREELVAQDPQRYVWRIVVPGETAVFKRYGATLALVPVTDTYAPRGATLATLEIDMVLQEPALAPAILPAVDALIGERLPRLEEFVHLKNGYFTARYAGAVSVSLDRLWSIVSDWNDASWVLGAQGVDVDRRDPYLRTIDLGDGHAVTERLVAKDDDTRTLTYRIVKGSFPVSDYEATLHLRPGPEGKTAFAYRVLFVPKAGVTADEATRLILERLRRGFEFIDRTLGAQPAS